MSRYLCNMKKTSKNWFAHWFDSPYYHILYKNRNDTEAHFFIDNLLTHLKPAPHSRMMDLACGKGRHARYIAEKGYNVAGLDLSPQSIQHAKQYENDHLQFHIHDMRQAFGQAEAFDYVFNFFTSFGYFDQSGDNVQTLKAANYALKKDAFLVIDFLNFHKVAANLVKNEEKTIDEVRFLINREIKNGFIYKHIEVKDTKLNFTERVQALQLPDFEAYLQATGFVLCEIWGSYALQNFDAETSDRLILLAQKTIP